MAGPPKVHAGPCKELRPALIKICAAPAKSALLLDGPLAPVERCITGRFWSRPAPRIGY
jgi:hypothetical protein